MGFAQNIHHRDFQSADNPADSGVGALGKTAAIGTANKALDFMGITIQQISGKDIFCQFGSKVRGKTGCINLAIANNAASGDQLDKDKIPPAKSGWRIANNKGFTFCQAHFTASLVWRIQRDIAVLSTLREPGFPCQFESSLTLAR